MQIIPFHTHTSSGSLLDSILTVDQYVNWAKENNIPAIGTANHGELSDCLELYKKCNKLGIKPIIASEFYVHDKELSHKEKEHNPRYHLVLIAYNNNGWENIVKLHNIAWTEGFYQKPRINYELMEKYSSGLIATSACLGGHVAQMFLQDKLSEAEEVIKQHINIFGDNYYLELQEHGLKGQREYNEYIIKMSKKYNVNVIIQNDAHYLTKEDSFAHEVLLCKNTASKISDPKRWTFGTSEAYCKTKEQLREIFYYLDDNIFNTCIENTNKIADKCEQIDLIQKKYNYPVFFEDKNKSFQELVSLTKQGFKNRFKGKDINLDEYKKRLVYELNTIKQTGFIDYFHMLYDLAIFSEKEGIYTNYGRGSAGASLVLYCLNVTHLDPIKYNLLFERFINPERVSAPDVDLDYDDNDRWKIIEYLKNKYGDDHVCYISNYGSLTSKSSFKAVASILELPFDKANDISKNIIDEKISLSENIISNDKIKVLYNNDEDIAKIVDTAIRIEGGKDRRSLHACGLIVSNQPLDDICPCVTVSDPKTKERVKASAYHMKEVDGDLKLLKLDVLGLRNLSIVKEVTNKINKTYNISFDFKKIEFEDKKTYKLLQSGNTIGVFQLESHIMQKLLKDIKPETLEDISIVNACARPGALSSGLTEMYIRRKQGLEGVEYLVPELEQYMKPTLGLMIYQEDVMRVLRVVGGYTMGQADEVRRIIGKKLLDLMPEARKDFVERSVSRNHSPEFANKIFDYIEHFGGYGFALPHSIFYSALSYTTAYLKANYTAEYMTALLNSHKNDTEKTSVYLNECFKLGVEVLPPDINISSDDFEIKDGKIIYSFSAIKGIGSLIISPLLEERNNNGSFKSFWDLINRVPKLNKTALESLLKIGALNSIEKCPKKLLQYVEKFQDAKSLTAFKKGEITIQQAVNRAIVKKLVEESEEYIKLSNKLKELNNFNKKKVSDILEEENIIDEKLIKIRKKEITEERKAVKEKIEFIKEQQELLFNKYLDNVEDSIDCEDWSDDDKKSFEEELMGFSITYNPLIKLSKYESYFDIIKIPDLTEEFCELNLDTEEVIEWIDGQPIKEHSGKIFSTIGIVKKKTVLPSNMAFIEIEYLGQKMSVKFDKWTWEKINGRKIKEKNMCYVKFYIQDGYNKKFAQYDFSGIQINMLDFINNKDNELLFNLNGAKEEIKDKYKKLCNILTKESNQCYTKNEAIKYITKVSINNKEKTLPALLWQGENKQELFKKLYFEGIIS